MNLRQQDIAALLYRIRHPAESYAHMAELLGMSKSAVFGASRRLEGAGLLHTMPDGTQEVARGSAFEFVAHALPYALRAEPGRRARGVVTAHHALADLALAANAGGTTDAISTDARPIPGEVLVWPSAVGSGLGLALEPLAPGAPTLPHRDPWLYRLFALVDVLRTGDAREREWARGVLASELGVAHE